jgi:serine/threonine-protein kinase HipA
LSALESRSEVTTRARVSVHGVPAAIFSKHSTSTGESRYEVTYLEGYSGPAISLTMPVRKEVYEFEKFPPFFDGLLPEGLQLEGLLRQAKIDKRDYFGQLLAVGADLVGAVTIDEAPLRVVDKVQGGAS